MFIPHFASQFCEVEVGPKSKTISWYFADWAVFGSGKVKCEDMTMFIIYNKEQMLINYVKLSFSMFLSFSPNPSLKVVIRPVNIIF